MFSHNTQLQISDLICIRQQQPLFAPVSFNLRAGEGLLIEGPNGSGKSSLLRILCGLTTPDTGTVHWQGRDIQTVREDYVNALHYVGHQNGLKLGLTAEENLRLLSSCSPYTPFVYGNILQKQTRFLSAGQKRKLALSKLFMTPKPLWILDEPLTALDIDAQTEFLAKLDEHLQQGGMCIITSHHPLNFKHSNVTSLRLSPC